MTFGAGVRLPYVGMGDREQPVAIYLVRALPRGSAAKEMIATGFGSTTESEAAHALVSMEREERKWRAVFVRPLAIDGHDLARGLVPFAIAVWDGDRHQRAGNKSLSGWKFLRLSRFGLDRAYLTELSYGYAPGELGDPARGKPLVESMCIQCHHLGSFRAAPRGMAPDLSNIGAISSPAYLKRALMEPNAPIVPHLGSRREVKSMPAFDSMSGEEIADMVAYLWTLGRSR